MIIIHDGKETPVLEYPQDNEETRRYTFRLRPSVWQPGEVYYDKASMVIPSIFNGYYFVSVSGGVSQATEPEWPCKKGAVVQDGCITWKAVPYNLHLMPGESIDTAIWSPDVDGVTVSDVTVDSDKTTALIGTIPDGTERITVNIHFKFNTPETLDRSFIIPVKEL